uniref:Uncharacterized protein n=1 Tax=Culex tarsalis TaxID=7177 RepID=A0A1Q3FCP3_CULTA
MDKKDRANKRRQDKHHKKPPPSAVAAKDKSSKKSAPAAAAPSSASLIVYDDPYSRRPIEPNWSRDRELSDSDDDENDDQLRAADLEKLLQLPASASGHFFLSTEKHWAEDQTTAIVSGRHFRIDSKQLNLCLGTIPFHERNGYPAKLFSKRELDSMTLKASYEKKKYQDYCNSKQHAGKMSESVPRVVPPPVKCLIGPDALPPGPEPQIAICPAAPPRPVPCLIGPMALPPELRHDPNVTGSYASSAAPVEVVPLGGDPVPGAGEGSSGSKKEKATAQTDEAAKTTTPGETKEDIQAWLDDILDA